MEPYTPRLDPVDWEQVRLIARLTPAQRLRLMLDARALAVAMIRARLKRQFPSLSPLASHPS